MWIASVSIAVVVLIGAMAALLMFDGVDEHGCSNPLVAHTAILVDRSDPLSPLQNASGRIAFSKLVETLSPGERLTYYEIAGTIETGAPTGQVRGRISAGRAAPSLAVGTSLCRPPLTPAEHGVSAVSYSSLEAERKRFRSETDSVRNYLFPVQEPLAVERASHSPILEYIQQIGQEMEVQGARKKRLVIFSDLAQHMPGRIDVCHDDADFGAFAASEYYGEVKARLDSVAVEIYYVERLSTQQKDCNAAVQAKAGHRQFWRTYIRSAGGEVVRFTPLTER